MKGSIAGLLLCVLVAAGTACPAHAAKFSIIFFEQTGDINDNGHNFFDDYTQAGRGTFEISDTVVLPGNIVMFSAPEFLSFQASFTGLSTADASTFVLGVDDFEEGDPNERGLLFDSAGEPFRFDRLGSVQSGNRSMCSPTCEVAFGSRATLTLVDNDLFEAIYLDDGAVTTVTDNVAAEPFTRFGGNWTYLKGTSIGGSGTTRGGFYTVFPDADGDGIADSLDNCPSTTNPFQVDGDGDQVGDACDNCISIANPLQEPSAINPDCGAACETAGCAGLVCENH